MTGLLLTRFSRYLLTRYTPVRGPQISASLFADYMLIFPI